MIEKTFESSVNSDSGMQKWFELENSKMYLGSEFLTWLFYRSISGEQTFNINDESYSLAFSDKVTISKAGNNKKYDGDGIADDENFIDYLKSGYQIISAAMVFTHVNKPEEGKDCEVFLTITKEAVAPKSFRVKRKFDDPHDRMNFYLSFVQFFETIYGDFLKERANTSEA